jgi:hypothetical protein
MSGGIGGEKKDTKSQAQSDPWDVAIPYIQQVLGKAGSAMSTTPTGPTPDQIAAANEIKTTAKAGHPFTDAIKGVATDLFETESRSPAVEAGYADFDARVKDTADGKNLDILNNPHLQAMLQLVGDNASEAVEGRFASAGRDFSGYEGRAIAKGVADAQTPLLLDQFNREQGRTDAAARDIYGANKDTQTTAAALDEMREKLRIAGIDVGQAGVDASLWGPETILKVEEMLKAMPAEDMKRWAEIFFPAGQLGSQESGTSQTKSSKWGVSASLKDVGTVATAIGSLSDRRMKQDVRRIGTLNDGQPVYSFRYLGNPVVHVGLMAQEVEAVVPGAVHEVDGVKFVDYGLATQRAAEMEG